MGRSENIKMPCRISDTTATSSGPFSDPVEYDDYDDKFMVDLTDAYIGKSISNLMVDLDLLGDVSDSKKLSNIKAHLMELRAGLQTKFREDY